MKPLRIVPPDDNVVEMSDRAMPVGPRSRASTGPISVVPAVPASIAIAKTPPTTLPLQRTPKAEGDHVIINPALRAWMER